MKKLIFSLAFTSLLAVQFSAVNATCTPAGSAPITDGGFFPASNTQPCVVKNEAVTNFVIQLKNFGEIQSGTYVISTRIDSIINLPLGLSWNMNTPSGNLGNTLLTDELGCIEISGITNVSAAIYNLDFMVTVVVNLDGDVKTFTDKTSVLVQTFNATFHTNADFSYFVNVINNQNECTHVVGIQELTNVSNLNVYPNPFSDKTVISFNSAENAKYTARLIDVMGKEVYAEELNAVSGSNMIALNRNKISSGVYFFVLSDGKATATKRLVVE